MGKRLVIDQDLCDKVLTLRKHANLTVEETAKFLNIGKTTVNRIMEAGYIAGIYHTNTASRRAEDREKRENKNPHVKIWDDKKTGGVDYSDVQGQMEMDLQIEQKQKPKNYEETLAMAAEEFGLDERDKKLMRFEAGQVEKVCALLIRIDDRLAQVLRRMDGCRKQNGQQ